MIFFFFAQHLFYSSHVFAVIQIITRLVVVVDSEPSTTYKQKYFSLFLTASVEKSVKYNAKNDYDDHKLLV